MKRALVLVVLAYILPAYSILKKMAEHRDELQLVSLRVDGSISFYGQTGKEAGGALGVPADRPELQADAVVYMKMPGRCRLEVTSAESGKISAAVESNGRHRDDGAAIAALDVALHELCAILSQRSAGENDARANIERHLGELKVDMKKQSLGRFATRVAYVVGDDADGSPQLWVDKDMFVPERVRFTDASGQKWDLQMRDYASPATGEWFPRNVELLRGDEMVFKFTALKADARAKIDDKLF